MQEKLQKGLSDMISLKMLKDYFYITIGVTMYGFGWAVFLLPYKLISSGVTGISSLLYYGANIPVSWSYLLINVALLVVALKILGFKFLAKTIYGILGLSTSLAVFQKAVTMDDGSLYQLLGQGEMFMSMILGAAFCGTGLAITFLQNGSTGGTDIIAAVVNKYRDISMGRVLLSSDVIIISSSYFVLNDWRAVVFGLVFMCIENFVLDYVLNSRNESVQFLIFSWKSKDIAHAIGTKVGRGITILDGHGWYSGQQMQVLCILAKKREMVRMMRMIKAIDPTAFVSVAAVRGVYGEGFDRIKVKPHAEQFEKIEHKVEIED